MSTDGRINRSLRFATRAILEAHPAVAWVRYPHLKSAPSHAVARKQMAFGSGMMSFGLEKGYEGARVLLRDLSLVTCAVSLGDAESLITHPASLNRARKISRPEVTLAPGVDENLIRLSIGLEDVEDLLDDLREALSRV